MWDLPRPGLEPVSPALAGRFSTTAPPGKPSSFLNTTLLFLWWVVVIKTFNGSHLPVHAPLWGPSCTDYGFVMWLALGKCHESRDLMSSYELELTLLEVCCHLARKLGLPSLRIKDHKKDKGQCTLQLNATNEWTLVKPAELLHWLIKSWEIINHCCFKPLSFEVFC